MFGSSVAYRKVVVSVATALSAALVASPGPGAQVVAAPSVIFTDDFAGYTSSSGLGTQVSTSLGLKAFGTLPGWTASGTNVVHAVDRDAGAGTNWAYTSYGNNTIVQQTGIAANTNGNKYTVTFDIGPSVYEISSQATRSGDGFLVSVLRADGTTLASSTQIAGTWDWSTGAQGLTTRSFTYTGDGSGNVKLKFEPIAVAARFNGAIDNVSVRNGGDCDPAISTVGSDTVAVFSTIGTCTWTVPVGVTSVRSLVVGAGGGGGGGGGGAGGLVATASTAVLDGSEISVTVGRGGAGANKTGSQITDGGDGGNSSFGSITGAGGGGGGAAQGAGRAGGSSGGSGQDTTLAAGVASQGFAGGNGLSSAWCTGASGGGGAGSVGLQGITKCSPSQTAYGGNGGAGTNSNITGSVVGYAGGGGGGPNNNSTATAERGWGGGAQNNTYGAGDGSNSNTGVGVSAVPGTGSGGGGGDWEGGGGNGATGIVVLRWLTYVPTTTTPSTTTTSPTTTTTVARAATTTTVAPALEIEFSASTTVPGVQQPTGATVAVTQTTVTVKSSSGTTVPPGPVTLAPTTTSTTMPNNAGGTVPRPVPKVQAVASGEAAVKVGDTVQRTTVTRENNQLIVSAGPLKAEFGSADPSGSVQPLDVDGNIRLRPGDTVRIKLTGFEPGSTVEAWMFSTPQLMGTAQVGDDGSVVGMFTIPEKLEAGAHRIAVVARTEDGKPATLTVGVRVGDWEKESSIAVWLIVLPILLAVAGALTLPATRRRRRANTL